MNELEIWENFKQGSEHDYSILYRKYAPILFKYGCKITQDRDLIKDSVQQVFFRIWKSRESISTPLSVKNYLLKALRCEVVKKLTDKNTCVSLPDDYHYHLTDSYESDLIHSQTAEQLQEKFKKLLSQLPDRQREVIFLKYFTNLSYPEIAGIMGIEQESVYKLTYKALDKLQQLFLKVSLVLGFLLLL
ncbi:RNA polymerase sigma factor [Pontibacter sp. 13R65]|uniref:RNA polymerase sigma factor n=1 Tax=Pontibacter sp. 13R65 TaxID=3127458 RepID=UPI00301DF653